VIVSIRLATVSTAPRVFRFSKTECLPEQGELTGTQVVSAENDCTPGRGDDKKSHPDANVIRGNCVTRLALLLAIDHAPSDVLLVPNRMPNDARDVRRCGQKQSECHRLMSFLEDLRR
jgi:hypothetical protein